MNLFENAVQTAKTAAKSVGKKAEEVLDLSKRKLAMSETEGKLEDAYCELGEVYYSVLKNEESDSGRAEELVSEINNLKNQLEIIREEIARLTNKSVCSACGAECEEKSVFCSKCGARLTDD